MNQLEQLKQYSTLVVDSGDFQAIHAFSAQDATTNPSLILKAVQKPAYQPLLTQVIKTCKNSTLDATINQLLVAFGVEILKIIPGRVSTEVDARLSFDTEGTVAKARTLIALYEVHNIPRERILIKIAATWEGIRAAALLEKEQIHCNLTLLFSLTQAAACADARVGLISPFVGRIYDWYKKSTGQEYAAADDPGVLSVKKIYGYYRKFGYATEVMGASFRNTGQILELAGCDLLTISPELLQKLIDTNAPPVSRRLGSPPDAALAQLAPPEKLTLDEKTFRYQFNQDAMATEKLAEGIRLFCADATTLDGIVERTRQG